MTQPEKEQIDMKLEVVVIPVADVDRAEQFYRRLGWRQDVTPPGSGVYQFTPYGSECSVQFGTNLTSAAPGSVQRTYLIVSDLAATANALIAAGIEVGEIFHLGPNGPLSGPDPEHGTYRSFAFFSDPDGNSWLLQEITSRLPGRVWEKQVAPSDVATLAELLRETEQHHGAYESTHGKHNWWDWYAPYLSARQNGSTPEQAAAAADQRMAELSS
jgi:catechol 2,3-dioxygenase-like lactoylglutathione lyase family enzyme